MSLVEGGTWSPEQRERFQGLHPEAATDFISPFCLHDLPVTLDTHASCVAARWCSPSAGVPLACFEDGVDIARRPCHHDPARLAMYFRDYRNPWLGLPGKWADAYCRAHGWRLVTFEQWYWSTMGDTEASHFSSVNDRLHASAAQQEHFELTGLGKQLVRHGGDYARCGGHANDYRLKFDVHQIQCEFSCGAACEGEVRCATTLIEPREDPEDDWGEMGRLSEPPLQPMDWSVLDDDTDE